jgi:two-component system CheB/CheR fusion protein
MAFVIVQHLDPHHTSHLAEILAKSTAMPVRNVEDGMSIRPNVVYVIPPNATMVLQDGVLRLEDRAPGLHLPVDAFFRSLALVQGSRAIGVILSGNASDGSLGVRAIKEECGLTFAQDEASAQHLGMPRNAIATGAIDYVLPPADIARELGRLSTHPYVRPPRADLAQAEILPEGNGELMKVFALLRKRTNVDFSHYKPNTLRRRIGRRMIVKQSKTLAEYLQLLTKEPEEAHELYRDLLISVTNFFRDPAVFDALTLLLKDVLLARKSSDVLRVWVPGCATGEEVYSLAICLKELTDNLGLDTPLQLFGTDISDIALDRARAGTYPDLIAQDVSPERLRSFFVRSDRGYQISKSIRESCIFARQDVTNDPPFGHMDLISCRNLLIYMDTSLQRKVLPTFHYSLNETGFLVLGSAESIGAESDLFSVIDKQNRIYGRKPAPLRFTMNTSPTLPGAGEPDVAGVRTTSSGLDLQKKADLVLQSKYSPPAVVIDANLQILHFRGRTGVYLEPNPGLATFNLLRMAREGLVTPLRRLVEAAATQNISVRQEGIVVESLGERREITIEVTPIPGASVNERYYVVAFQESAVRVERPRQPVVVPPPADPSDYTASLENANRDLKRELLELREQLRNANEDHEAHVEELRASNEEVRSANEELQSMNEELSTTKEELQSANEELTTLNEELLTRNNELNTANSDFGNLLTAVNLPFAMVDNELRLRRFSEPSEDLMGVRSVDIGHPVAHLSGRVALAELQPILQRVIATLRSENHEIQDRLGHWYSVAVRAYRTLDHRIDGAVVVLFDIDTLKRALRAAEEARDYAEGLVDTVREPLLVLDADLRIQRATPAFYETFRVSREETEGRFLYDLGNGQWNIPRLRELLGESLFRDRSFQDFEIEHTFPHIGSRRMRLNGKRISPDGDRRRSVLLAIEDITERREQAEIRYQRMFETAKDGMLICDAETGKVTDVNPFFLEITGYGRESVVGHSLPDAEAFRPAGKALRTVEEARSQEIVRHDGVSLLASDGRHIQAELVANRYVVGGQQVVQVNIRDVTARIKAVEALRESEARFRLLVESVRDYALFQMDASGIISTWNIGAERVLGYSEPEILGQPLSRIFTPEDVAAGKPQQEIETAARNGSSGDERWHLRKDGSRFFASGVLTAIFDSAGRLHGFAKIMRDVTERRKADEQLVEQERLLRASLAEKEVLLKEIHHRVKNNLQIIASLLNLQSEFVADAAAKAMLAEMNTRVRSIAAIHELLYAAGDLSRIEFGRYVKALVRDVVAVHGSRGNDIRVDVESESIPLEITQAVPSGLIVNELLTNALKHAFPESRRGLIKISFRAPGTECVLEFSDDGIGLPENIDPQNVNSLGFQLVHLLVQQLDGRLAFTRNAGTTITIAFPRRMPAVSK